MRVTSLYSRSVPIQHKSLDGNYGVSGPQCALSVAGAPGAQKAVAPARSRGHLRAVALLIQRMIRPCIMCNCGTQWRL